jgi:hypothetical protein
MRIDLSDLDRLEGFVDALARLFWGLIAVAFLAAIFGSAGTGLLVLILGAASFVVRAGLEDFVRSRRDPTAEEPRSDAEREITIYRSSRRRTKSAV